MIFKSLIFTGVICFTFDAAQAITREFDRNNEVLLYLFNIAYYISLAAGGYLWFLYSEAEQGSSNVTKRSFRLLTLIPTLIIAALAITAPFNHLLFYITETGVYQRGSLHFLQLIISYGYIVITSLKAFVLAHKEKDYTKKHHLNVTASLIIPVAICGVCQIFLPNLPILCVGYCDSLLFCYIAMQEEHISIDPLTGISNRRRMYHNFENLIEHARETDTTFGVLMIDVDKFKSINDTYGHVEGDRALAAIAEALRKASKPGLNIYRYGGDEFIMTSENGSESELWIIAQRIQNAVAEQAEAMNAPYKLAVSVGFTSYQLGDSNPRDIINRADAKLYEQKQARKTAA